MSANLATLPADARAQIEADKIACYIRYQCRGLAGAERQRKGNELLRALKPETEALVREALKRRAGNA